MIKNIFLLIIFTISSSFCSSNDELKNRINELLTKLPGNVSAAILIYNPQTQDTIYSINSSKAMIPASNTKLFTTATALNLMGANYELYTKLLTAGYIKNGTLIGDLYIKGYGNSVFSEQDLKEMIRELKDKGIKKIQGNIIGDDSYFDEDYFRDDWINDETDNVSLPPISALVLDRNRMMVREKVRIKHGRRYRTRYENVFRNVTNPPLFAAQMLKRDLISAGISVNGIADKGIAPEKSILLSDSGILLKDLIKIINKHSDNFLAECLFKTIGAVYIKKQGNAFYSTQAVMKFIKDNGIFSDNTSLVDGSGLSRYDIVTVDAITGVLEKMYFDKKNFNDFISSLSIAGVDGTLRYRMIGSSAENHFHGKTGTLSGVSSLSGYLTKSSGNDLIVSILFNYKDYGANFFRGIENKIVEYLADTK